MRGLLLVGAFLAFTSSASAATPRVLAIHFDADVNPVTQNYLCDNLSRAAKDGYTAAVIVLNTPGGLLQSKDKIVLCELNAKLPVLVWVGPNGATAGSAGVWIAAGRRLPGHGASDEHRVLDSDRLGRSQHRLRSPSQAHQPRGRDSAGARAESRTQCRLGRPRRARSHERNSPEALQMHVIDAVAPTLPSLLEQADGVKTKPRGYTLHVAGAQIHHVHLGFFTRLLNTLIDPNILPLLFLAGLAGIGFEIFHPGVVLPGALGAVALVTALFGFSVIPISWGGLLLMLLGVALLVIDVHVTTHGALTVAGLISLAVGSIMLFQNAPGYHTSKPLVISVAVALGAVWAFAMSKALQVRHSPVEVGPQLIAGSVGEVRENGLVYVNGELWQARAALEGEELTVRVRCAFCRRVAWTAWLSRFVPKGHHEHS